MKLGEGQVEQDEKTQSRARWDLGTDAALDALEQAKLRATLTTGVTPAGSDRLWVWWPR